MFLAMARRKPLFRKRRRDISWESVAMAAMKVALAVYVALVVWGLIVAW